MDFKKKIDDGILEKLVHINRITKVVKGGRRFGFSALVVVGNQAGKIGIAHAKAKQVPDAIKKANETARRKLIHIPLREGRTIHHDVYGKVGAGKIISRSLKNISAQIIDDVKNITLLSSSSIEKNVKAMSKVNKTDISKIVAEKLAKKAVEKKITKIYFDRGVYKYYGRVKAFAETLRKNGMEF